MFSAPNAELWIKSFSIRRCFRIFPVYIACSLLAACVTLPLKGLNVWTAPPNVVFSFAFLLQMTGISPVDDSVFGRSPMGIGWALSIEVWLGIFFFASVVALRRHSLGLILLLILCVVIPLNIMAMYSPAFMDVHYRRFGLVPFGVLRGAAGFSAGILAFRIRQQISQLRYGSLWEGLTILLAAWMYFPPSYQRADEFLAPLVGGFIVIVFSFEAGLVSKLLSTKPFALLGAWSFGIYMDHPIFIDMFELRGWSFRFRTVAWVLFCTVALAALLHYLLEKPMMSLGSRLSKRMTGTGSAGTLVEPGCDTRRRGQGRLGQE